jgi:hypothetical protein
MHILIVGAVLIYHEGGLHMKYWNGFHAHSSLRFTCSILLYVHLEWSISNKYYIPSFQCAN